jgi:molybdopterin-guanine dinucleotide biosynthesis protein A
MTSIVLAGGKSSRLGRNKLMEAIGGRPLLARVLDILGQVSDQVIVVVAQGQELPGVGADPRPMVTADIYPGKGALGGIYTGVLASASFESLVVGADMPFLSPRLLSYLMSLSAGFDVVMPRIGREIEPLHAVYSKTCLEPMKQQIERADLTIRHVLDQVRVRYVGEDEINGFDPNHLSFFNVNTPSDLKKAEAMSENVDEPQC